MREKRLYWCPFCHRNVSLWRTKDGQLICPRCSREILEVTDDGRIVAIKGKDFPGTTKKSTLEQIPALKNDMGRVIVSTGRGGAGKSTFVALATRYLKPPKLLIDLDPDESLATMLGVDLVEKGKKTVSGALYDILQQNQGAGRTGYNLLSEILLPAIQSDCLYRGAEFDLITLGTKFTVGCYCTPDTVLKDLIPALAEGYEEVLIDSPAGLEHFNRKVVVDIDDLFIILDPSEKALKHIERVIAITRELKVNYKHLYLIGNHRFTNDMGEYLRNFGEAYLGKIDYDPDVKQYNLKGKALFELPEDSPASLSVRGILVKAGCNISDRDLASGRARKGCL